MEYSPPPLFKQGASARAKVIFFAMIAIALLVIDARMNTLTMIRQGVGIILYPLQSAALMPRDAVYAVGDYFSSLSSLQKEVEELKRERVANAQALQQGQYLMAENAQLRALLTAAEQLPVKSVMSEILYDTRDAFTRKIVVDRGAHHGITAGQPVIDDIGVVGQVTRVFPLTSEITLLTDKDFAIPVQVVRSGVRSISYGRGQSDLLDLRFMAPNADIRKGDVLVTTGIDGVYPPGLAVAAVTKVESKSSDTFARIICQPSAGIGRNKQLLILMTEARLAPRPEPEAAVEKKGKAAAKRTVDGMTDPAKAAVQLAPAQDAPAAAPVNAPAKAAPKPAVPIQVAPKPIAPVQAAPKPAAPAPAALVQIVTKQAVMPTQGGPVQGQKVPVQTTPDQVLPKPNSPAQAVSVQTPLKPAVPIPSQSAQAESRQAAPAHVQVVPRQAVPAQNELTP